ncbi:extracellular solute-binding protein [Pseudomonas jilinensis]|uniref:Spermidine/putrescine ABC transporter substrate-binding protein PotF n=1 Tax=Pseudomonas jilinensis TaxID=2078689 RepID=A0A396RVX0_9PSED|nr:extracellular solute-binding protein [Pseudomonas jilinensis]RHW20738.1 spermidine/putrescine ABC transporter substrate-binding protein PotF [Pseudomonas jilinensis]
MRLLCCVWLLCCSLPLAASQQLNLFNWPEYLPPEAIQRFQEQTGIEVRYDTFDSPEVLESTLLAGASGYDLVFPSTTVLAKAIQAGALQQIDGSRYQYAAELDPELMQFLAVADPNNRYAMPYTWGTIGLGINRQAVERRLGQIPLNSLDLLFKPEYVSRLKDCGVSILDSPQEVIAIALNYLGHDPYASYPPALRQVAELLAGVQPNLRYVGSAQHIDDLASGEICLALTFNGDAGLAAARAAELGQPFEVVYRIPREGSVVWFDSMAIPVDAPNSEAAHRLIDFMLQPEVLAEVTNELFFANASLAAGPLVDPQIVADPDIYPTEAVRARLFVERQLGVADQRQRTRLWSRVVAQH